MDAWIGDLLRQMAELETHQVVDMTFIWFYSLSWQDFAEAIFVGTSVVGQHFISQRRSTGFWFWLVGNVVALFLFASLGRWPTVGLYVYFTWKCISGLRTWKTLDEAVESKPAQLCSTAKVAHAS